MGKKSDGEPVIERWPPVSGLAFYRRNWRQLLAILAPAWLAVLGLAELTPVILASFGVEGAGLFPATMQDFAISFRAYSVIFCLGLAVLAVIALARSAALEYLVADLNLVRISWDQAWQGSMRQWRQNLAIPALNGAVSFVIFLFGILVVPLFFLVYCWIKYSLALFVKRLEGLGGMRALNRSWSLTDQAFGRSFRAWTLSVLPWFLVLVLSRGLPWWGRLIADAAGVLLFPLPSTYLTLLYVELRYRKDNVPLFTLPAADLPGPGGLAPGPDGSAPAGDA